LPGVKGFGLYTESLAGVFLNGEVRLVQNLVWRCGPWQDGRSSSPHAFPIHSFALEAQLPDLPAEESGIIEPPRKSRLDMEETECSYQFAERFKLAFTGTFGRKAMDQAMFQSNVTKVTDKASISSIDEFWRVANFIPTFLQAHDGFSYYWFKEDIGLVWEDPANRDGFTVKLTYEEPEEVVSSTPTVWEARKADLDARITHLLLVYMGGSNKAFTDLVNGIVVKIRRTRVGVELWLREVEQAGAQKAAAFLLDALLIGEGGVSSENTRVEILRNRELADRSNSSSRSRGRSSHSRERGDSRRGSRRESRDRGSRCSSRSESQERGGRGGREREREGERGRGRGAGQGGRDEGMSGGRFDSLRRA